MKNSLSYSVKNLFTYSLRGATMKTDVYAARSTRNPLSFRGNRGLFTGFISLLSLAGLFIFSHSTGAATRQDLQNEINLLGQAVTLDVQQSVQVINALSVVTAPVQSVTAGHSMGSPSDLGVYYKASTTPVSSLQFDVVLSSGMSVTSVSPGLASQAAGKSVQGNPVQVGHRILIFGLNQTAIPSGPVVILRINTGGNVGKRPISLTTLSASSPSGGAVPITGKSGSVTIP